jgi:hypothetical protein
MLQMYRSYREILAPIDVQSDDLPDIPADTLEEAYGALSEFTEMMDYDCVKMVLDSVKEFKLPAEDKAKMDKIQSLLLDMNWEKIREVLGQ